MTDLTKISVSQASREAFLGRYGELFEHSPWVVERTWDKAPFADAKALHEAFLTTLADSSLDEQLALIRAHPELADRVAQAEGLTAASAAEQSSAGLTSLTEDEYGLFHRLNASYRERFEFPFIICVRLHNKDGILRAMEDRLDNNPEQELKQALTQVGFIVGLRLADA